MSVSNIYPECDELVHKAPTPRFFKAGDVQKDCRSCCAVQTSLECFHILSLGDSTLPFSVPAVFDP